MFTHEQIWAAFEVGAERCGISLSALSKRAGLDPTSFNPSKRHGPGGRQRWPSTETLSRVLQVADMDVGAFAEILDAQAANRPDKPLPSRRQSRRFPTILAGCLRLEAQASQIPCRIRDISATGARIWLSDPVELPSEFELAIPRLEEALRVRLVWSRLNTHGVMFLEELRASGRNGARLLDMLQIPDNGQCPEVACERLAPGVPAAPKRPKKSRECRPRRRSRQRG